MESKELTVIERAAVALGTTKHETELLDLVKKSESITVIKNAAGREQCHSALMTLKTARVGIEKAGKAAREDATQFSKAVIAEEKRLVAITQAEEVRLQEIRDAWDEAREAEKRAKAEAEAKRVAKIRDAIDEFRRAPAFVPTNVSTEIDEHADDLARAPIELDFYMELTGEAQAARDVAVAALRELAAKARVREAEEARIAAEREELARRRAEQDAKDRAAREAEEAARREEQRKAEEALRAERAEHERQMAAERAEFQRRQDEAAAEQRRAAAELQRQQDEIAAERRRVADEEARKQREAEMVKVKAAREQAEREAADLRAQVEAENAVRLAENAVRLAAPALLEACQQFVNATDTCDEEELESAYQSAKAAIEAATTVELDIPF